MYFLEDKKKTKLFETMSIPKAVLSLSLPVIVSSLVVILYNLADTYFVGMLNAPVENAAVTLAAPVMLAFNAVNNLFGVGSSSMMSRALGRKDYDTVYRSSAFGFFCALTSGILFSLGFTLFRSPLITLLGADKITRTATGSYLFWTTTMGAAPAILNVVMSYLVRAEGSALHASIGTMSGCVLNMILDPIFILPWGLNLGASGAGCATFLANCFACLYYFVLLFCKRGKTYVCISPKMFCFRSDIVKGVCAVGIPASIQNLLNVTGMTVLNNFTSAYQTTAVAAMGISQKVNMIPLQISLGFSQGIMPLISYNYASKNIGRMKKGLLFGVKLSMSFLLVVSVCYYIFAGNLVTLFMKNEEIVAFGTRFLRTMCLGQMFLCMDFIAVGVFQACGMGKKSLLFAVLRKIVLEIPALFLLNHFFPLYGLPYAQVITEVILAIAAVCMLRNIFRTLEGKKKPKEKQAADRKAQRFPLHI